VVLPSFSTSTLATSATLSVSTACRVDPSRGSAAVNQIKNPSVSAPSASATTRYPPDFIQTITGIPFTYRMLRERFHGLPSGDSIVRQHRRHVLIHEHDAAARVRCELLGARGGM
jgi:hypothetical protein